MTIWDQLGITETKDIVKIKSAYAAKAKECHPEEQPEEFQKLQKAYKAAVKYAKSTQREPNQEELDVLKKLLLKETEAAEEERRREKETNVSKEAGWEKKQEADEGSPEKLSPEDKGEIVHFNYDEVQGDTLADQFFQEFFWIAWNPWLMNNLDCWEAFLYQRRYRELFSDSSFRKNLVMTMDSNLSGWYRKTIRFMDTFLKNFQKVGEENPETSTFLWKWKKNRPWNRDFFSVEKCVIREQKELHDILMAGARKRAQMLYAKGKSRHPIFIANGMPVVPYLQLYLAYAQRRPDYVERLYRGNHRGRMFFKTFFISMALFVLLMFCVKLVGDSGQQPAQQSQQEAWEREIRIKE